LNAASFASVPEVAKKNLSSPFGITSRSFCATLARTSHVCAGLM
jgi:hypothetical protein